MRPDPPIVLRGIAAALVREVAPEVSSAFGMGTIGNSVGLLTFVAQEFDRAAARLVAENKAIVSLFRDALDGELVQDRVFAARMEDATCRDLVADLHVPALQRLNDELRAILVDLHAAIDSEPSDGAAALSERIWDELKESTRRRHLERIGR
jgi:hypothetical protein